MIKLSNEQHASLVGTTLRCNKAPVEAAGFAWASWTILPVLSGVSYSDKKREQVTEKMFKMYTVGS